MKALRICTFTFAVLAMAVAATAQHSDVVLEVVSGKIVTVDDVQAVETRVYESDLAESGIPGLTDEPGFASSALAPNSLVGYNVSDSLLYWDGAQFVAPPEDEFLEIQQLGLTLSTVTGESGYETGFGFAQADGAGHLHQHIDLWVKHPTFDPGDPLTNPISVGAYVLQLELTSSVHDTSEPFAIVFNNGLSSGDFETAVAATLALIENPCPGDLDGDGVVDLSDLATLLASYGVESGAAYEDGDLDGDGDVDLSDLAILLAVYGVTC